MSVVNESLKATTAKRVTYGIDIRTSDGVNLNEWGLHESQAKEVNELLTMSGGEPITVGVLTFSRRKPSDLSAALAAVKAKLQPVNV